jgi:hypothetical protein
MNSSRSLAKNSPVFASIATSVYQTIVLVCQRNPDWLAPKGQTYAWAEVNFRLKFISKLTERLLLESEVSQIIPLITEILKKIFYTDFFLSSVYVDLILILQQAISHEVNETTLDRSPRHSSILLLDAENLSLDIELERILTPFSEYPIRIKIAFANWRNLGNKKDVDFHQRGYDLIHVPPGKNHADFQMTALGISITLHYQNIKTAFVCSSDKDFHHLSNTLVKHGLVVYQVYRQGNELLIHNLQTLEKCTYGLYTPPSLEELIAQIKVIAQEEQIKTNSVWVRLSHITSVFQRTYKTNVNRIIAYHLPGKKVKDIFQDYPTVFTTYQPPDEKSELYVTLFVEGEDFANTEREKILINENLTHLHSQGEFLVEIDRLTRELLARSERSQISINNIGSYFRQKHGIPITKIMSQLGLGKKLPKIFQFLEGLQLTQVNNNYFVGFQKENS